MSVARKSLVLIIGTAAVAVCVALVVTALALGTATGARLTLRALDLLTPGELHVGAVDGTWLGGLVLRDVRYVDDSVDAEAGVLRLAPDFGALARGVLELRHLAIDGGRVAIADGGARPATAAPPALPQIGARVMVRRLSVANVRIDANGSSVEVVRADGALSGPELDLGTLEVAAGGIVASGAGLAALTADGARTSFDARLRPQAPESPWQIEIAASAALHTASEPWLVSLEWHWLVWHDTALGALTSPSGRLVVTPGTEPAAGTLTARLEGVPVLDAADVAAAATYDEGSVAVAALGLATLGGAVVASGAVDLAERAGTLALAAHALDPARIDTRLAGDVGGDFEIGFAAAPAFRIDAHGALAGELNGRMLDGTVRGRYMDGALALERAALRVDEGHAEIAGTLGRDAVDLRFTADLPDVGTWYPPARGALTFAGEARGPARDPTVHASIDARELALAGAAPRIDALELDLDGTLTAHTIGVRSRTAFGTVLADIEQGWDGHAARGTVQGSTLAVVRAGTWTLAAPVEYALGASGAALDPACYVGPRGGRLCATLEDDRLAVSAARIPSQLAAPWLPPDLIVTGAADAELALDWRGAPYGTLSLDQSNLTLELARDAARADDARVRMSFEDLTVRAALDAQRLEASLGASLGESGDRIDGALALEPPAADGALTGRVTAALTQLALLDALVDGIDDIRGRVRLDVDVGGSAAQPTLDAQLRAESLRASVPALGVAITDGALSARAARIDEPLIELDGELCTAGCVTFTGRAQRRSDAPWSVSATLAGERIAVADLPQLRAAVAPNLTLRLDGADWRLAGSLDVAEAALTIANPPRTAVRPAPETIVHGRETDARPAERVPASLLLDVRARLGDVRFEGLGVSAELDGALELQRRRAGSLLVQGTTAVESGTFRFYGQELAIERGLLIFTGPLDDPTLDIRATRTVGGAQVGLSITGTASNARSEVFSNSGLSDSEAFARLVTGRSLASTGTADAEALERAAIGLGLSRVVPSLDQLGANLGLSELGFDTGANGTEGGVLVAGRQLGDDFLLRYTTGLFDDFSSIELIYRITERLRLHTESGTAQSIDLVYEVDPTAVLPTLRELARRRRPGEEPASRESR